MNRSDDECSRDGGDWWWVVDVVLRCRAIGRSLNESLSLASVVVRLGLVLLMLFSSRFSSWLLLLPSRPTPLGIDLSLVGVAARPFCIWNSGSLLFSAVVVVRFWIVWLLLLLLKRRLLGVVEDASLRSDDRGEMFRSFLNRFDLEILSSSLSIKYSNQSIILMKNETTILI
jgi:hypothetical protein